MEKEFVKYEIALELKELGFDEPCFGRYDGRGKNKGKIWYEMPNSGQDSIPVGDVLAPTFSQAFRWFREKYKLKGFISPVEYLDGTADTYHWCIYNECNSGYDQLTNEEAELECLKKLIEIVKEQE